MYHSSECFHDQQDSQKNIANQNRQKYFFLLQMGYIYIAHEGFYVK